jgi:hypothetical protein
MLLFGIAYHVQFMLGLRRLRESMREEELIHGETVFPVSLTLITAFLLLAIGIAAIVSMEFQVGPFGGGGGVIDTSPIGSLVPRQNFRRGSGSGSLPRQERENAQNGEAVHPCSLG